MWNISVDYGFAVMTPKAFLPLPTTQEPYAIETSFIMYPIQDFIDELCVAIFGQLSYIEVVNRRTLYR